jgi:hypothetical protein
MLTPVYLIFFKSTCQLWADVTLPFPSSQARYTSLTELSSVDEFYILLRTESAVKSIICERLHGITSKTNGMHRFQIVSSTNNLKKILQIMFSILSVHTTIKIGNTY